MLLVAPVLLGVLGIVGILVARRQLKALASGPFLGRPAALFAVSLAVASAPVLLLMRSAVPAFFSSCDTAKMLIVASALILGATWTAMLAAFLRGKLAEAPTDAALLAGPGKTPPMQLWMQDLIVAALCYGFGSSFVHTLVASEVRNPHLMLQAMLYLFVAGSFGFFVASDVCRRSSWGQHPVLRAGIFTTIFFVFPLTLPLAFIAWLLWRGSVNQAAA